MEAKDRISLLTGCPLINRTQRSLPQFSQAYQIYCLLGALSISFSFLITTPIFRFILSSVKLPPLILISKL